MLINFVKITLSMYHYFNIKFYKKVFNELKKNEMLDEKYSDKVEKDDLTEKNENKDKNENIDLKEFKEIKC